jgi:hypothetical protein
MRENVGTVFAFHTPRSPISMLIVEWVANECAICVAQHCNQGEGGGKRSTKSSIVKHSMFIPHCAQFTCMQLRIQQVSQRISRMIV